MPGDEQHLNDLGQPIGLPLPDWTERPRPPRTAMVGRFCAIEPLDPERHAAELFAANGEDREGRMWTYLPWGPFDKFAAYRQWAETASRIADPFFHAIIDAEPGQAVGAAAYLRTEPQHG